jgi:hypothetical protein
MHLEKSIKIKKLFQYANSLFKPFDEDFEDANQHKPSLNDPSVNDVYYAKNISRHEMFNSEKELLRWLYESESDDLVTLKFYEDSMNQNKQ